MLKIVKQKYACLSRRLQPTREIETDFSLISNFSPIKHGLLRHLLAPTCTGIEFLRPADFT